MPSWSWGDGDLDLGVGGGEFGKMGFYEVTADMVSLSFLRQFDSLGVEILLHAPGASGPVAVVEVELLALVDEGTADAILVLVSLDALTAQADRHAPGR